MFNSLSLLPVIWQVSVAFVFGLLVGSFLNVVILRLPRMMQNSWRRECCDLLEINPSDSQEESSLISEAPYNLILPRSHCPKCRHQIRFWENIPILSFLILRGKCAGCGTKISWRYPAIELFTGIASGFVVYHFGAGWTGLLGLLFLWALITLTVIDFDTQLLPDDITLPLLWLGLIANATVPDFIVTLGSDNPNQWALQNAVFGAVAGYLFLWGVYWLFKLIAKKEGMGYGDFKLLAALGAWMGWQALPIIVLLSSLVGAVYGIGGMLIQGRHKNQPFAFGPFLAIAGLITLFWGESIWRWYMGLAQIG